MSPRIAAHPPSKTCLTVSSDEIPPQPLPPAQDEAERSPLRDTDQRASEATAFYKLPVEVVQRYYAHILDRRGSYPTVLTRTVGYCGQLMPIPLLPWSY